MGMTFADMAGFVRTQADADSTDAPDDMLTVHARIAYHDILSRKSGWDHLEVKYTLLTVASQAEYAFTSLSGGTDMERVYSIASSDALRRRLTFVTRQDAEQLFGFTDQEVTIPAAYTVYNDKIVLFPTPSGAVTLNVRGFRQAAAWPNGSASEPDLPKEFHEAIAWYMLSGYYMAQEDAQMAGMYLNEYQMMVERILAGQSNLHQSPRPRIMGGQNVGALRRTFSDRIAGMLEG